MYLTVNEKIKIVLSRRKMTMAALADKLGQSRQNVSNKFRRNSFSEEELQQIAAALGCTFRTCFTLDDTGEEI